MRQQSLFRNDKIDLSLTYWDTSIQIA